MGTYFVPREALDIDYCDTTPAMVVDEFNYLASLSAEFDYALTFEEIMSYQTVYAIQDKVAWRQDPFMFHQANAMTFSYDDPVAGITHNVSLISLWAGRVVDELMSYFSLPITHPQMWKLIEIFQQRDAMDSCGITTTLGVDENKQVVSIAITSTSSCQMSLSGILLPSSTTVTTETVGVENTSWITLTAGTAQTFLLSIPRPL